MEKYKKPSEIIQEFIRFLEESKVLYEIAKNKCDEYDSLDRHIYWDHKIEFAKDKNERNRIATAHQKERLERRRYKNTSDLYKEIHGFTCHELNKAILKRLKTLLEKQKKIEEYLFNDREYKAGDKYDNPSGQRAKEG